MNPTTCKCSSNPFAFLYVPVSQQKLFCCPLHYPHVLKFLSQAWYSTASSIHARLNRWLIDDKWCRHMCCHQPQRWKRCQYAHTPQISPLPRSWLFGGKRTEVSLRAGSLRAVGVFGNWEGRYKRGCIFSFAGYCLHHQEDSEQMNSLGWFCGFYHTANSNSDQKRILRTCIMYFTDYATSVQHFGVCSRVTRSNNGGYKANFFRFYVNSSRWMQGQHPEVLNSLLTCAIMIDSVGGHDRLDNSG